MRSFSDRQGAHPVHWLNIVVGVSVIAYAVYALLPMFDPAQRDFHDFRIYYLAADAFLHGEDPYQVTFRVGTFDLYYIYPPVTLFFFVPFAWLSYDTACIVFLVLKGVTLVSLVFLWMRLFLKDTDSWFLLFCLLAFNNTIYIDFQIGNIETFIQILIWTGLACFIKGRYTCFSALILAAALFKITPILLLTLLLLHPGPRSSIRILILPLGVVSILVLMSYLLEPGWPARLGTEIGRNTTMSAPLNQSFLNFVLSVYQAIGMRDAASFWPKAIVVMQLLATTLLTAVVVYATRVDGAKTGLTRPRVYFVVLAYLLILPRLQDYQFALAIVPVYFVIMNARISAAPLLFLIVVVQAVNIRLPGLVGFYQIFFQYKLLIITYAGWIVLGYSLWTQAGRHSRGENP